MGIGDSRVFSYRIMGLHPIRPRGRFVCWNRMKDSRLVYDYLRRWWWLLLLGPTLGAIIGLAYYSSQAHPTEYSGTASVSMYGPFMEIWSPPPKMASFNIDVGSWSTEQAAIEYVDSTVRQIDESAEELFVVHGLSINGTNLGNPSWKAIVLGSILGGLLAIGAIYTWEDARGYPRNRRRIKPSTT